MSIDISDIGDVGDVGIDPRREFEGAFDRLWPRSRALAARLLGPGDADDIAAEAMARLWAHWPKVGRSVWVDGWALRVTTNLAIDRARRRVRVEAPKVSEDPSDTTVLRLALTAALAKLPRRQREAVTLRYLTDLSEAEVAHALGITAGSVKTHLHRGLATLRTRLGTDFSELNHGI